MGPHVPPRNFPKFLKCNSEYRIRGEWTPHSIECTPQKFTILSIGSDCWILIFTMHFWVLDQRLLNVQDGKFLWVSKVVECTWHIWESDFSMYYSMVHICINLLMTVVLIYSIFYWYSFGCNNISRKPHKRYQWNLSFLSSWKVVEWTRLMIQDQKLWNVPPKIGKFLTSFLSSGSKVVEWPPQDGKIFN